MADTAVAITAGAGTNIDTRTEDVNSNHRQVIVLGDPVANTGVAPVDGTAGLKVNLGADNDVTVTGTVDVSISASVAVPVTDNAGSLTVDNAGTFAVQPKPATSGDLTIFRSIDLDETEEEVKATAGQVYAVWVNNNAVSTRFLKFYNATAANVTVGTTTPVITLGIPGNTSDDIAGSLSAGGFGIAFDTAITVAATTGIADNDTGAPAANDVVVNIFYK